jgi:glycosyltransferase involved in cell wall biosynthesis
MERNAIIVPTYNERENIRELVHSILGLRLGSRVIIVDDNSPDGTGHLAGELAAQLPDVGVIHRPRKLGLGTAHATGIRAALAGGATSVVTMDADFSHDPCYIPALLNALNDFDVVVGSRYVPAGAALYCALPRRALSRGANLVARIVLGLCVKDSTSGFRAYSRAVLESIGMDEIVSEGYSFLIEVLYRCQQRGWHIGEIPIVFKNRQRGASKISRSEIYKAVRTVVRLGNERSSGQFRIAWPRTGDEL